MSFFYYPITWLNSAPLILLAAILLDSLFGEVRHWHPLVGFGNLADWLEPRLNRAQSPTLARVLGLCAWLILLLPFVTLSYFLTHLKFGWLTDSVLLYLCIGARSLKEHALQIYRALISKELAKARLAVGMIVSRDTQALDEREIATATVESVLENGNDAIFGAMFWFLIFGGAGAVAYRLANTLDAMWGYRTPRFLYFGWAAARLDDGLNLIPARLTALSYALCGHTRTALYCWRQQAHQWYSPNAGPVMAAGAGALRVQLGGEASYHGKFKSRPLLGQGQIAEACHILLATQLVRRSVALWCVVTLVMALLIKLRLA